jgi:hypothetical protein
MGPKDLRRKDRVSDGHSGANLRAQTQIFTLFSYPASGDCGLLLCCKLVAPGSARVSVSYS